MINKLELQPSSRRILNRIDELYLLAEGSMRGKTFETKNNLNLVILLQFTAAANRIIHSLLAQVNGNSFYGVDYLLRPMVELFINYKYIKEDSTGMRSRAFLADDIRSRLANLRRLIRIHEQNKTPGTDAIAEAIRKSDLVNVLVKERIKLTEKYGAGNLIFHNLEERARLSSNSEMYSTVYWLLCQDTHVTARGLDRHMKLDNNQLSVTWDLDLERFNKTLQSFYIIFSAMLVECSQNFGIPDQKELDKFEDIPL